MDMCCSTRSSRHLGQEILTVMRATYLHVLSLPVSWLQADILLRGYSGWNTRRAVEALDTIFPKVRSGSWHVYGDPNLGLLFLLGLPNLSAFKCRKKLLKVIIGNLVFTRRWVNNIVSKLQGLANLKWSLPHKVVAAWMRICSSYFSWVLADIIAKSSHCFWKCDRKSKFEFHYSCSAYIFSRLNMSLSAPTVGSWWSQWVVMAANQCCSGDVLILCEWLA
jgi:hypothetical protein